MENQDKYDRIRNQCQIAPEIKEKILAHLDAHGPASLLLSTKFAPLIGCFLDQIGIAMTGEWAPAIRADIEQDAPASPADEATESPAAVGFRRVSKRVAVTYGKGGR